MHCVKLLENRISYSFQNISNKYCIIVGANKLGVLSSIHQTDIQLVTEEDGTELDAETIEVFKGLGKVIMLIRPGEKWNLAGYQAKSFKIYKSFLNTNSHDFKNFLFM